MSDLQQLGVQQQREGRLRVVLTQQVQIMQLVQVPGFKSAAVKHGRLNKATAESEPSHAHQVTHRI